jgi:hypothetical protein
MSARTLAPQSAAMQRSVYSSGQDPHVDLVPSTEQKLSEALLGLVGSSSPHSTVKVCHSRQMACFLAP